MLAQRRGGLCWAPAGCHAWKWRDVLAMPAGLLAIVWLAWLRAKRKRRKRFASSLSAKPPSQTASRSSAEEADFILCLPEETVSTLKEGSQG
jgi:hypothetical protein